MQLVVLGLSFQLRQSGQGGQWGEEVRGSQNEEESVGVRGKAQEVGRLRVRRQKGG